jgi:transcriptional regulator with XRE-family HTH domain
MQAEPNYEQNKADARAEIELWEQVILLREKSGLTQSQLAEILGVTQSRIAKMEKEGYDSYSIATLRKVASATNHTLKIVFEPIEEMTAEKG